jgi:DNA gyrase subunit A
MRYTEARLSQIAEILLDDIDKNTVDFADNFDGSLQEPLLLPAKVPNLLLNGVAGIAVGMATNIPPHNLNEVAAAVDYLIGEMIRPEGDVIDDELTHVTSEDLMQYVQGPDFPTGGMIVGSEGIVSAYATGRGRIVMRAAMHTEQMSEGRFRIVVTEIPYQINKTTIIERIAQLVREGKIDAISDLRDESDRRGMSIVIELKRGAQPKTVMNRLLKYTPLQSTFGVQMLALVNGEPRLLSLKGALKHFIQHRQVVIQRRTQFDLERARRRAHILEGLLIAIGNLDAVIQTIRQSDDAEDARNQLMTRFELTEPQAQAILDMQLRRLAALERHNLESEYATLLETIADLENLLATPRRVLNLIRTDLNELAQKHGDARRTQIIPGASDSLNEADLVTDEDVFVFITRVGYIKRVPVKEYRIQGRGGKGMIGMTTRDTDDVAHLFAANSLDSILFFSDKGKVYQEKAYQIPDAGRTGKGIPLHAILNLDVDETITATLPVPDFDEVEFCTMVTRYGRIKRVEISEFSSVRPSGLIAMGLEEGDTLNWVKLTNGDQDLILVTENGQSIRFNEEQVRAVGRTAQGVNAIRLQKNDVIAGVDVIADPEMELLVVTRKGYGKRTPLGEYPQQLRYGLGVRTLARNEKTGPVLDARVVKPSDHLTLITAGGKALRTAAENVSLIGRNTQGVRIMKVPKDDYIASIALHDEARRVEREEALAAETHDLEAQAAAYYARLEAERAAALEAEDDDDDFLEEEFEDQGLDD